MNRTHAFGLQHLDFGAFERLSRKGDLIPVFREIVADTETPVSAFLKLGAPSHAFLFESVVSGERWGRYSFLADTPLAILRHLAHGDAAAGYTTLLEEEGRRTFTQEARPLDAARRLLSRHTLARADGLPRFVGGLVGYLGHAVARWFEPRVPQRHGPDPLFPDGEWMLFDRMIVFDNLTHRIKLVASADLTKHPTLKVAYRAAMDRIDGLSQGLAAKLPSEKPWVKPTHVREDWDRPGFVRAVQRARDYIRAGDCMQVVLSRRLTARFRGDPFQLYRSLRGVSPTPYLFFLRLGERALAGASPELLVRLEDDTVTLRPIAGTRPRGKTAEEDRSLEAILRKDPKERAEHVMLLDLGRNDVGRVASPGTVRVEEREVVERYSHVMHLVSQVSGRLSPGFDAGDVIAACFPAGTVSGAPKVRALEIIDELEPLSRGPYAGAVGYMGFDGSMDLAIAIRTLALAGNELRVQAGAGIVHDSDPFKEYEETTHKMQAALVALGADVVPTKRRSKVRS